VNDDTKRIARAGGPTLRVGAPLDAGGEERTFDPGSRRVTPAGNEVQARAGATATARRAALPSALVVKLGGRALEAPGALSECAAALREAGPSGRSARAHALAGRPTLVVHGGGAEVTAWCARAGIEARFADGLRVTDPATLEIATAVLAGLANKRLVAALRAHGVDAVGLAALDGGIARVSRHPESATLGEVGAIDSVDTTLLESLLAAGRMPVLASLGDDGAGALLNLNADDVAAAIAAALPAGDLLLLSDTPGLKLGGTIVRSLDPAALEEAIAHPEVSGGMLPKLRAARLALAAGVQRVHIAAWQGARTITDILGGTALATTCHSGTPVNEETHA
jgi:acetylglutamate kinase